LREMRLVDEIINGRDVSTQTETPANIQMKPEIEGHYEEPSVEINSRPEHNPAWMKNPAGPYLIADLITATGLSKTAIQTEIRERRLPYSSTGTKAADLAAWLEQPNWKRGYNTRESREWLNRYKEEHQNWEPDVSPHPDDDRKRPRITEIVTGADISDTGVGLQILNRRGQTSTDPGRWTGNEPPAFNVEFSLEQHLWGERDELGVLIAGGKVPLSTRRFVATGFVSGCNGSIRKWEFPGAPRAGSQGS
ncbi:MAG: hypothetical protein ACHQWV_04140, partial [Nitrospirales bacterium]